MTDESRGEKAELQADAVVIGGGVAGQAAAIHLARGGLRVICLEPRESFKQIVGESLDWSAPQLFAQLGLTMEELVESGAATFKRHITVTARDGSQEEFLPGAWLTERPWNVESAHLAHRSPAGAQPVAALGTRSRNRDSPRAGRRIWDSGSPNRCRRDVGRTLHPDLLDHRCVGRRSQHAGKRI